VIVVEHSGEAQTDWFQPNTYSVWVYEHDENKQPILLVAYEWERVSLRAIRLVGAWLSEDWRDENDVWEDCPDFNTVSGGIEASAFAALIEQGKVKRIGAIPPVGAFSKPPSWLESTSLLAG
jgi:hypothetical protein